MVLVHLGTRGLHVLLVSTAGHEKQSRSGVNDTRTLRHNGHVLSVCHRLIDTPVLVGRRCRGDWHVGDFPSVPKRLLLTRRRDEEQNLLGRILRTKSHFSVRHVRASRRLVRNGNRLLRNFAFALEVVSDSRDVSHAADSS